MPVPNVIKGRYEIREVVGKGGMGVVYNAYDKVIKRNVALKTLRESPGRTALDLFYKECDVLASMSHPNIVEIFDIGEYDEDGVPKPYFVMPLLPGKTLHALIQPGSSRLSVERSVEILSQTCRGLQAAHERGLVHRDLKPSNIFVMDDDSVKIIDFGVVQMADHSTVGHKGTLLYMAPEQVEMKAVTPLSDIFALGVVCYETFTSRHPFERGGASDIASAILKLIPPPVSDLNPSVNATLGRVVHKAMAKQPWYRFASAKEMADALTKAARNAPVDAFEPARILPRIERAQKALEQGDHQFADEILTELEAEGHVDSAMTALRRHLDQARRQKLIGQLLESARTRAEQEEYPLALQKLQELLALDPANGVALALKSTIENRRSDRKIDDWLRLARQHLEQNGFGHARQALQNVLEVKPGHERALQLLTEVDHREQESLRIRQEKEALYQKAVDAWQSGEVSVAMTKLERLVDIDRRATVGGDAERSATFQNFYNEVRTEHEATRAAYEQARRLLGEGSHEAALAICNQQLARRPGQALFQALKLDVEEAQRQVLSARIAEVDHSVDTEADLDKRVSLLADALEQFPGEPHFERMLRTTREKRDLVNSIVSRARALEEMGQFIESLAQWEILRSIYGQYPGLDFEVDRIRRRRDQQLRADAKVRCVEQIDWELAAGNFERARDLLRDAATEFPGDGEFAELEKLTAQGAARAEESHSLLLEGQEHSRAGRFEAGIEALQRAHELDPKSAVVRRALTAALIELAHARLDVDWESADALARRALSLDPDNPQAKSVCTLALDRKRDEAVDRAIGQARRLQGEGEIDAALKQVDEALSEYPRHARLTQLRNTLLRSREAATCNAPTATVVRPAMPVEAPVAQDEPTVVEPAPLSETVAATPAAAPVPAAVAADKPATDTPAPPHVKPSRKLLFEVVAGALGCGLLIGGAALVIPKLAKRKPAEAVRIAPPIPITPATPTAPPPPNAGLRILSDADRGKVTLDGQEVGEIRDGQFSIDSLAPGKHLLLVGNPRDMVSIEVAASAGSAPVVQSISAKEVIATAVAGMGAATKIHSSLDSPKVTIDGQQVGQAGPGGLDVNGIGPGNHDLAIGEGKERRSMMVTFGPAPLLTVFLKSDRNAGALVVLTGEDGARVYLDGKEYRRQSERGQVRIPNLPVKEYLVRVAKEGFLEAAEQHAAIRKGEELKLEFKLQPVPRMAALSIHGALPGAQVILNGNPIGVVQDDGSFSASGLSPGQHVLELHKESYRPIRKEKRFDAGATVELGAADIALEKLPATLKLKVTPADAKVMLTRQGEAARLVQDSTLSLPEGTYTVHAQAPDYVERSLTVAIAAGETKAIELSLSKTAAPKIDSMSEWEDSAGWIEENGWHVRKGGNFVAFGRTQTAGSFTFTADLRKGKRMQWVVAHTDARNYVLLQVDRKSFYRILVTNGKETQLEKVAYAAPKGNAITIQMDVAPDSLVNKYHDGTRWVVLDAWSDPARKFSTGQFGFLVPRNDVLAISNFSFAAK